MVSQLFQPFLHQLSELQEELGKVGLVDQVVVVVVVKLVQYVLMVLELEAEVVVVVVVVDLVDLEELAVEDHLGYISLTMALIQISFNQKYLLELRETEVLVDLLALEEAGLLEAKEVWVQLKLEPGGKAEMEAKAEMEEEEETGLLGQALAFM